MAKFYPARFRFLHGHAKMTRLICIRRPAGTTMKAYMCVICGFVYEEAKGHPESGVAPGTKWEEVPLAWRCPDCGAGKEDFEMIEI
jgi:rubredoxin